MAEIRDGFEESGFHSKFNQTPSVQLQVFRVGDQSPLDVSEAVYRVMESFEDGLPPGVSWRIDGNRARQYRERKSLLINNGLLAVVIVLGILTLFLELRLAFWVMTGMTASFIGGIVFLPAVGVSISMISMFAFLVVLGIVVDDAVVVGENVYEARQSERDPLRAAIKGAREVAPPVIFSILTTVVAFVPLLFIPGTIGKFWKPLPIVVIVVLLVSLVEALLILPSHLAHARRNPKRGWLSKKIHEGQQAFARAFKSFVDTYFRRLLEWSLGFRYITITAVIALFVMIGGYASSSHMGMILMPEVSPESIRSLSKPSRGPVALVVMYSILAVAFRSYLQPLIVLAAIPFGIVGAVIGHILLGFGIVFATAIILLLVPCLYLALEDLKFLGKRASQFVSGN